MTNISMSIVNMLYNWQLMRFPVPTVLPYTRHHVCELYLRGALYRLLYGKCPIVAITAVREIRVS